MIIKPTNKHPCLTVLRGIAAEYDVDRLSDELDKEDFISVLKEKWTINLKFRDDDINSNIIELEIDEDKYIFLLLRYLNNVDAD